MSDLESKVGFKRFTENLYLNVRLNIWYTMGYLSDEEARKAGAAMKSLADWKREFVNSGKRAECENLVLNAAFYYRIAEFHTPDGDPDKEGLSHTFQQLYDRAVQETPVEKHLIPSEQGSLSAVRVPTSLPRKGVIVLHGGDGSELEDFTTAYHAIADKGYEVIAFQETEQGPALHQSHLKRPHKGETPIDAVLDYFTLERVILVDLSFDGDLALRAAVFESRIERVILFDLLWDLRGALCPPLSSAGFMEQVCDMRHRSRREEVDAQEEVLIMRKNDSFMTWVLHHGCDLFGIHSRDAFFEQTLADTPKEIAALVNLWKDRRIRRCPEDICAVQGKYVDVRDVLSTLQNTDVREHCTGGPAICFGKNQFECFQ